MLSDKEISLLRKKKLCRDCTQEPYLSDEIERDGRRLKCSYCGSTGKCYLLSELSERIEEVFEEHFVRTSDQPDALESMLQADKELNYQWERDGQPVIYAIMDAANIPEEAARDIQALLDEKHADFDLASQGEETEFCCGSYYEEKSASDNAWREEWDSFERSLKTEARFFSKAAQLHLTSVFGELETLRTRDGRPLIVSAGPGSQLHKIYRARAFQSIQTLKEALERPDLHLGPPPPRLARAGRMNAYGISVFYGANTSQAALAEVRPPVGSHVLIAKFEIIRPIRLLDLPAFSAVATSGSIFDPLLSGRLERAMFLRSLSQRISRPVMPDDEALDYLATQVVADFLATESSASLDGIIFESVQAAKRARNIVLFQKAAKVEALTLPYGTEISSSVGLMTEEGWQPEFSVIEELPAEPTDNHDVEQKKGVITSPFATLENSDWPFDHDWRESTLRVDVTSAEVYQVQGVKLKTDNFKVNRYRWTKSDTPF